jgi:hypothetical protein
MSDDLIKRLRVTGNGLSAEWLEYADADRIEELEERNKELTLQLLAAHGQAADALDKAVVAKAKLAKAMAALQNIANAYDINWHAGVLARAVLADLEGTNE